MADEVSDIIFGLQGKSFSQNYVGCFARHRIYTTGFQAIILVKIMSRPLSVIVIVVVVVAVVVVVVAVMQNLRRNFD